MERINWKLPVNIITLVIVCEFIYWSTSDLILFNTKTLNHSLEFLYYTLPAFLALALSFVMSTFHKKMSVFLHNLLFVLTNTYIFLCVLILLGGEYCDIKKNLDAIYFSIVTLLLVTTGFILVRRIIPKMELTSIITVIIATIFSFMDFIYLLMGYRLFYPGNW
jgi:hypothetical protein